MKKSFKSRIDDLGLSYKKELTILFVVASIIPAMGAVIYFLFNNVIILVSSIVLDAVFVYFYLSRYASLEKQKNSEHVDELISLLSYFEIFISNGNNVYSSFKLLLPYASLFMDDAINSLLSQIDADKSIGPYINFAAKFENNIVESLMLTIYQMVDNGSSKEEFGEFNHLFSSISKDHHIDKIEGKRRALDALNSWPLFGAGAITIILAMSILSIVGEYINVI